MPLRLLFFLGGNGKVWQMQYSSLSSLGFPMVFPMFSEGFPMGFPMLPMAKPWEDWMQLVPNLLSSEGWSMALARPKANLSHCDPAKGDAQRG